MRHGPDLDPQRDVIIEIGTERGEGSTQFFADLAEYAQMLFVTVDVNPDQLRDAVNIESHPHACAVLARGEDFLERFDDMVDGVDGAKANIKIAYLDNFDWWWSDVTPWEEHHVDFAAKFYEPFGLELNNDNSQATHLKQAQLVHEHNDPGSIIIFDDTWQHSPEGDSRMEGAYMKATFGGTWDGKGGTAVPWLLEHGYEVLEHQVGEQVYGGFAVLRRT